MKKHRSILAKCLIKLPKLLFRTCFGCLKLSFKLLQLSCLIAVAVLFSTTIIEKGQFPVPRIIQKKQIHELIPHTKWSTLRPCGAYFDEIAEYKQALQCSGNVIKMKPSLPPRCFVITTDSPDIFEGADFNGIPIITPLGTGRVVGFYDEFSETIYIVENIDAASTYRHESQHHFQHISGGVVNHEGPIWNRCEKQYYEPSIKNITVKRILAS